MRKVLPVVLVAMLLAMAATPLIVTTSTDAEYTPQEIDFGDLDSEEYAAFTFGLGLAIGLAVGFGAGFGAGFAAAKLLAPAGIPQETLNEAFRQGEAQKIIFASNTSTNMASSILPADTNLWAFTANYWERAIEYAVAEYWSMSGSYDPDFALKVVGMLPNVANYLYTWSEAMDNSYNNINDQSTKWSGPGYNQMQLSLVWGGNGTSGTITGGTSATDTTKIWTDFAQFITPTGSNTRVFIDNDQYEGYDGDNYYDTIYSFATSNVTITNVDTGLTYRLVPGANDISSIYNNSTMVSGALPTGLYSMPAGHTYGGPFIKSAQNNAAPISGGLVLGQGSTIRYALPIGDTITIYGATGAVVASNVTTLEYNVSYNGPDGPTVDKAPLVGPNENNPSSPYNLIKAYNDLVQQISVVIDKAVIAGEAVWDIYDIMEESSMWISPSSITTNVPGYTMSAPEIEAVYIQLMRQVASLYLNNQTALDEAELITNLESIKLYCYGDIYYNGSLWAENVVFTPYITTTTQTLSVGSNTWNGSGFAMVWAQVDSYAEWNGQASLTSYGLVDLHQGYVLNIEKIVKDHQDVQKVDLTLHVIKKYNSGKDEGDAPPLIPEIQDTLLMVIIIVILAIVAIFVLKAWKNRGG